MRHLQRGPVIKEGRHLGIIQGRPRHSTMIRLCIHYVKCAHRIGAGGVVQKTSTAPRRDDSVNSANVEKETAVELRDFGVSIELVVEGLGYGPTR